MLIYDDGYYELKVLDTRPIDKINFNPMCHTLMVNGFLEECIQIKINSICGLSWINVRKIDLKEIDTKSMIGWNLDGRDLSDYLRIGDIADAQLIEYVIGCVPPIYPAKNILMMGEPYDSDHDGNYVYLTFEILNEGSDEKYAKYLGICSEVNFSKQKLKSNKNSEYLARYGAELIQRETLNRLIERVQYGIVTEENLVLDTHSKSTIIAVKEYINELNDLLQDMININLHIDNLNKNTNLNS